MEKNYLKIEHGWYGCDTGCCGTRITEFSGEDEIKSRFEFSHFEDYSEDEISNYVYNEWPEWNGLKIEFGNLNCP